MFEIHITVNSSNIELFKKDCNEIGCKPILINFNGKIPNQLMTSQKFKGIEWENELNNIKYKLNEKNYNIQRIKVEIYPKVKSDYPIKYLESHIRVKTTKDKEIYLDELCNKYNFHKSLNSFKEENNNIYIMCTYRTHDIDLIKFKEIINNFNNILKTNNFISDKIEIEGCILDTNEELDKDWLK